MKKVLGATLVTILLLGGLGLTAYAVDNQTTASDQTATVGGNKADSAAEEPTLESSSSLSSAEEATQDSQVESKEQSLDEDKNKESNEDSTLTTKEVTKMNQDVAEEVAKQVNDSKKEKVDEDVLSNAESIRKALLSDEYGITEKQLKTYSDDQLMNAATLFKRYNQDLTGMDLGAFVSLLNALYQNKTLAVDECLTQLSFDPKSFGSFTALADHIDALQVYLKTLYPSNSSFMPLKEVSNEELATILKNLQVYQNNAQAAGEPLAAGPIALIGFAINHPDSPNGANGDAAKNKETNGTETEPEQGQATKTSESSDKKETAKKESLFPKTGEKRSIIFGRSGAIILLAGIGFYFWNRRKETNEA